MFGVAALYMRHYLRHFSVILFVSIDLVGAP